MIVMHDSSCHMLIDKALSSDKSNGHWFEADWLHCKRDALSSNRKVDGSRLTCSTKADCRFRTTPEECLFDSGLIGPSV